MNKILVRIGTSYLPTVGKKLTEKQNYRGRSLVRSSRTAGLMFTLFIRNEPGP